jgi:hypothetical protein
LSGERGLFVVFKKQISDKESVKMSKRYLEEYQQSIEHPEAFWQGKANALPWFDFPKSILSKDENGIDRWFADGVMNTSFMAIDHHVNTGRGDQAAIIYDSPATGHKRTITYSELLVEVSKFAGVLKRKGVEKGDRSSDCNVSSCKTGRDSFSCVWWLCC